MKTILWFDFHRCWHGPSKIGYHFRKQSGSKIEVCKNDDNKKPPSKLIFFYEKKIRKIRMIFDIENWLWMSELGPFWRPLWTSVKVKSKNYFSFTNFLTKIKPLLTHSRKTPPLRSHYYASSQLKRDSIKLELEFQKTKTHALTLCML